MTSLESLTDILFSYEKFHERGINFIDGVEKEKNVSYEELLQRALGFLDFLQKNSLQPNDELIIQANSNQLFLDAWWAAVLGGIVPVPLSIGTSDEHKYKLFRIFKTLKSPFLITDGKNVERLLRFAENNNLTKEFDEINSRILRIEDITALDKAGKPLKRSGDDRAFIQFSSGSTSTPKGIIITHKNLITNINGMIHCAGLHENDSFLSWMPLTHDMGLIGFHLMPFIRKVDHSLMTTDLFIRRPNLWLEKITEKKRTISCSPNFGYQHFLRFFDDDLASRLKLDSLRIIFNGAEPISVSLVRQFNKALAPCGLKSHVVYPVYGLAEATLAVAFPIPERDFDSVKVDRDHLKPGDKIIPDENGLEFISEGYPVKGGRFKIADQELNDLPEMTIGCIWITGDYVTSGYYDLPDVTHDTIKDGWLNTGDLGLIMGAKLVVTGRSKEIIFLNGQNIYPHDIENILIDKSIVEGGNIAIAGIRKQDDIDDEVVAFIRHKGKLEEFIPTLKEVSSRVNEQFGIQINQVIRVRNIPKTTSGKIQRFKLIDRYKSGDFNEEIEEITQLLKNSGGVPINQPQTTVEQSIKDICDEIIPDIKINPDDNIFECGTNSLSLALIHEQIEEKYPGKVEITDFFDYPSIRAISGYIQSKL